jgi:hypothetical protein
VEGVERKNLENKDVAAKDSNWRGMDVVSILQGPNSTANTYRSVRPSSFCLTHAMRSLT